MANDKQLVKRKVFKDNGELIREGMAPKDVPFNRDALLSYWEKEDAKQAQLEADQAEAALAANEPAAPSAQDLVGPLEERLVSAEAELGVLRGLKQATPEFILEGVHQIARAAGAAALVEAAATTAISTVDAAVAGAQALLRKIEGSVLQAAQTAGDLQADFKTSLERTSNELTAKTTRAINQRIAKFEIDARKMVGPRGKQGRIGQGLIAGAGKRPEKRPDGSEWSPGDSWMNTKAEGFTLEYLQADGNWSKPARLVPAPKLINAQQNVLDMAPRNTLSIVQTGGSGGGGGSDRLTRNRLAAGSPAEITDSSNWAHSSTASQINGGTITVRFTELGGAGRTGLVLATFTKDTLGGGWGFTEYAALGGLFSGVNAADLNFTFAEVGATAPAGITVPTARFNALKISASVSGGGTTGVTFMVEGSIEYIFESKGGYVAPNQAGAPAPAWLWT